MDLHVITTRGAVLVAQVIEGRLVLPQAPPGPPAGAAPAQPVPGK